MGQNLPLLLSAALGNKVNRPPVWMMRQAGRYMKIYRDLRERYPSFRERSENPELSYEIPSRLVGSEMCIRDRSLLIFVVDA